MIDIFSYLRSNSYPGRGILLGRSASGSGVIVYFIMGRSENSRNRVFVMDGNDMRTKPFDPAKLTDPSLVIYRAVANCADGTVVTNGDQTDTIATHLASGGCFESALRTRTFEPDAPNFTPRISGIMHRDGSYKLSILKRLGGACGRQFFEYDTPENGVGHFISTYKTDGEPLPSFEGEPLEVAIDGDAEVFAGKLWSSLNADNRVSLFVRYIEPGSGMCESFIINRHEEEARK